MMLRVAILVLCLAVAAPLVIAGLPTDRRGGNEARPSAPAAATVSAALAGGLNEVADGALRLEAVSTVELFCDLVDSRRLWRAAELFATPRVWPRRALRALRRLEFRWARVHLAPGPYSLVVAARVRAAGGPASPVRDGESTLIFTLGRVGTTTGGWLITAVTTSP